MVKNHFVPKLIIRKFTNSEGKIYFFSKKSNSISQEIPYDNQLQEDNFYSQKSLSELKDVFSHILINPLFREVELNLEKNLEVCLESKFASLLSGFLESLLNGNKISPCIFLGAK